MGDEAASGSSTAAESGQRGRRLVAEAVDLSERGGIKDGQPQRMDRRLFMQLLVFTGCKTVEPLAAELSSVGHEGVLYVDVNDARGVGLLTITEEPDDLVTRLRAMLVHEPFASLTPRPEFTMLGRTYALGYEPDLAETLLDRPRRTALNRDWPWAVWYPLRRSGRFAQLPAEEQRAILMEHGQIGFSFGAADLGHDIRLASFGLDRADNDFVVGLVGKKLHPLSALVQTMRKTQQTALYLERLGPFFVGKAVWQSGK